MSLESIVDVTITTKTKGVTRKGFGVPMLAAYHTKWPELFREYEQVGDLEADGFAAGEPAHKMASAVFGQTPKLKKVIVGRLQTAHTQVVDLLPQTITEDFIYKATVIDPAGVATVITRVVPAASSIAAEVTALVALFDAVPGISALDVAATTVRCTVDTPGEVFFYQELSNAEDLVFKETSAAGAVAADLAAIDAQTQDWYGLGVDLQSEAILNAVATFTEVREKLHVCATRDDEVGDPGVTTDIMSDFKAAAISRSAAIYSRDHDAYAGLAWDGVLFSTDPGSATWKFKTLALVTVDNLQATFESAIADKNGNQYQEIGGVNITCDGTVGSGEFLDIVRGRDWLVARLRERVFSALANNPKIPYTNSGVNQIVSLVRAQLREGIAVGFLAEQPAFVVTAPLVEDVDVNLKAARLLPDIEFSATLAGAIHAVQIKGVLKL